MECQGIIAPVGDDPSDWCHPLVTVAKDEGVRITVDLSHLNSQVSRPMHPSPTPFDAICRVTPIITIQAPSGSHGLLSYWRRLLPSRRHSSPGDAEVRQGGGRHSPPPHIQQVDQMLRRCRKNGIALNGDKFVIAAPSVSFCSYTISNKGIEADQDRVSAIRDFPTPANVTDLRSFTGLVNQLSEFTPSIAATAQTLRPLLSPNTHSYGQPTTTRPSDVSKKHCHIHPYVSRLYGIGYALLEDHGQGRLRLVQCGSRFLTDPETRYATIELEMLASVWATAKCKPYLIGVPNFLMTDHRPLIPIFNKYTLDAVENPCLQRLKGHISPYQFTAVWRAGKQLCIPDALSRAPVSRPTSEDKNLCNDAATHMRSIVTCNTIGTGTDPKNQDADRTLQELREAASVDPDDVTPFHVYPLACSFEPCGRSPHASSFYPFNIASKVKTAFQ
ncbi:hypothetical protein C7M84_023253 [Penaeus vannamei]|uniref:Reverse transcriptase RNase H-like domain-containing protein n=1 Tax=Penaeus vannamei TaxID=6689 RepID=A0A3R7PEC2_PENVA|nr:hypothetical protein C7M84_023253 [Penaeus vannamei]